VVQVLYRETVDFSVLGPLRVEDVNGLIEIRGGKERLLLARLVAASGRLVTTSELIDTLWDEDPPASAAKSVQTFVLRLRNALEPHRSGTPAVLLTDGPGYRLALDLGQVDAERFARLARIGQVALADGRPDSAGRTLGEALALWRGPAYAGFDADFAHAEARRLEELRLAVTEDRVAADLALGRAAESVPELEQLVGDHPHRERLWEMLVTALYRSGRQGDALGAYERARTLLSDELGVDPGAGLRSVHARVLAHDRTLGQSTARSTLPLELRPTRALVGRDGELQRLRDAWQRAVRGRPCTIVVRGPAGAGGSALAAAFAAEVAREGAEVRYAGPLTAAPASLSATESSTLLVADHARAAGTATLVLQLAGHLGAVAGGAEVIDLAPLETPHVREIVADYVFPDVVDVVTEEVERRSGGWPGAVHDAAVDAARERAMRRVEVAAAATGASTSQLATARAELADNVALLQDTTTVLEPADPATCPWRGLAAYDVDDARWYAGRERLVAELVARLAATRLLALVGASGSGKSSALRAGLLAALRRDVLPGSAAWPVVTMRPGQHPMKELARGALGQPPRDDVDVLTDLVSRVDDDSSRLLVVVDQFEEVWTVCPDDAERRQFLDTLSELATDPRSPVTVVLGVRADFLGQAAEHEAFRSLLTDGTVFVGPMTPAEIRRAVERPAAVGQLTLEDGLADTLVSDAGQEPGLLPLLSTAMTQMWERREVGALTYSAYVALGGLSGAIATLAEESYAALPPDERATARTLLLRLTGSGDGAGVTRRRVPLTELEALPQGSIRTVVEDLARARLLTVSRGSVEVAHEALFREWPRLRGWLEEDAAGRAVQRRLAVAATEWDDDDRDPSALWAGTRLVSGLEVEESRPEELTSTERAFLGASRDAVDAAQREAEERAAATARQNRRLRRLLGGIAGVLVLALVAGTLAWRSRQEARAASVSADAQRLAATALNIEQPDVALLAAVEGTKLKQSPETYGALLTLLARQPRVVHRLRLPDQADRIATGQGGAAVFLGFSSNRVSAVSTQTGRVLWAADMPLHGYVASVSVTPDGRGVLVPEMGEGVWGVVRFDAATGRVDWQVREAELAAAAPGAKPNVIGGGFRADGRFVAVTRTHVFTLDPATGRVLSAVPWPQRFHTVFLEVWPDGKVSREGLDGRDDGLVFDPAHPELGTAHLDGLVLAVSPDASRVLVGRETATGADLRVVDGRTLKDLTRTVEVAQKVFTGAWSPDGTKAAIGVERGVLVLDPQTMALQRVMVGHSGPVNELVFTGAQHDLVWTAGQDGTSVAFDLSGTRTPVTEGPADPQPIQGSSSVAAHRGVYVHFFDLGSNTAFVSDTATGRDLGQLVDDLGGRVDDWADGAQHQVETVAMTPDGSTAIVGILGYVAAGAAQTSEPWLTDHGAVVIFDALTRQQRAVLELPWPAYGIAVTPDSRRAVVNGAKGYAVVDLAQARLVDEPVPMDKIPRQTGANGAETSPDGRWAALARNREIVVVDLTTGKVDRRAAVAQQEDDLVQTLAWSANSKTLVAGTSTGWLHVLSAAGLTAVAPPRHITGGWVRDLEVSPDGRLLASSGEEGDVMLWDTRTWRPYGQPVTDDQAVGWLTFSADGRELRIFFEDQHVVQVSTSPGDWVTAACRAAGRNLTPAESAVILPGRPVRPTCP
jgi:DNA-binding SARP family transcriptional activator/WD40 repeat protein